MSFVCKFVTAYKNLFRNKAVIGTHHFFDGSDMIHSPSHLDLRRYVLDDAVVECIAQ